VKFLCFSVIYFEKGQRLRSNNFRYHCEHPGNSTSWLDLLSSKGNKYWPLICYHRRRACEPWQDDTRHTSTRHVSYKRTTSRDITRKFVPQDLHCKVTSRIDIHWSYTVSHQSSGYCGDDYTVSERKVTWARLFRSNNRESLLKIL